MSKRHGSLDSNSLNTTCDIEDFTVVVLKLSVMFYDLMLLGFVASVFCDGKPASKCDVDSFPCLDGSCVEKSKWCDGEVDCRDGSDEQYCFTSSNARPNPNNCDETLFMCKDGRCIPLVGRCDGYRSCWDNSDEEGCGSTDEKTEHTGVTFLEYMNPVTDASNTSTEFPVTLVTGFVTETNDLDRDYINNGVLQADSTSTKSKSKDEVPEKGFVELKARDYKLVRDRARQWLLSVRDKDHGWKEETARALTALYMADTDFLQKQYDDNMLMTKQLHLQLLTTLIRNRTSPVTLGELSLFINALSTSCDNPRNFYGIDLVKVLRSRTDVAQASATFLSPIVYITLCLNDAIVASDLLKIPALLNRAHQMNKIDIEALASLAATCIARMNKFKNYSIGQQAARRLYRKITQGLPDNMHELSLVSQALNEGRINQDLWNRSKAMDQILNHQESNGSFGGILSTYYTMPVLSGKSLLSLGQHCGTNTNNGSTPLEVIKNGEEEKIYIRYSLYFGNPVEVSQTLMMKVKKSTNFFDVMRLSETMNPVYKFIYGMSQGKPTVYSIGDVVNDPERGLYWRLYVTSRQNSTDKSSWIPYDGDVRNLIPEPEDTIIFWIKPLY